MFIASQVDFVYVNFNSYVDVCNSISSLSLLVHKSSLVCSVTVVDNSFTEASPDLVVRLSSFCQSVSTSSFFVSYQPCDSNIGFGAACNRAAKATSAPLIAFVNCDTDFTDCSVQSFLDMLNLFQHENIAVVGPKVVDQNGLLHASCFSFDPISILLKPSRHIRRVGSRMRFRIPRYSSFKRRIDRITYEGMDKSRPSIVDWVSGCFAVVRKDFFTQVSGFDERYFLYFEDVDLCRKARQFSRFVVFDSRMVIVHRARHQSASREGVVRSIVFNHVARYHISSWFKYCLKWRHDFIEKLFVVIGSFPANRTRFKTPLGYSLDFSKFSPLFDDAD